MYRCKHDSHSLYLVLRVCLLLSLLCSCGKKDPKESSEEAAGQKTLNNADALSPSSNLNLFENMSYFNLEVSGCASGFQKTYTQATFSELRLMKNDQGCLAKLLMFASSDGTIFSPASGFEFKTYLAGDFAIFTNLQANKSVKVSVRSQLSSPLLSTDVIDYTYSGLKSDLESKSLLKASWDATGIDVLAPKDAPKLRLKEVRFTDIRTNGGRGRFDFYLECEAPVVNGLCFNVSDRDLRFALGYDIGNDCSASSPAKCEDPSRLANGARLILPGQNPVMPNGGFIIERLDTPGTLASSSNLILLLQREKDNSAKPPIKEARRLWNLDLELTVRLELLAIGEFGLSLLQEE